MAGKYGDTLRYAAVRVQLALDAQNLESAVILAYKARWDEFVAATLQHTPHPLQNVFHATPVDSMWAWGIAQGVCAPTMRWHHR